MKSKENDNDFTTLSFLGATAVLVGFIVGAFLIFISN